MYALQWYLDPSETAALQVLHTAFELLMEAAPVEVHDSVLRSKQAGFLQTVGLLWGPCRHR